MKIPNAVKIGGIEYAVTNISQTGLDVQREGSISYREQMITICDTGKEYAKITFLHECIHGMLEALGLYKENENENLIDGLAHQLYQLLEDNPSLMK